MMDPGDIWIEMCYIKHGIMVTNFMLGAFLPRAEIIDVGIEKRFSKNTLFRADSKQQQSLSTRYFHLN